MSNANIFELDKLENPGVTTQGQRWSFFTDRVMGGLIRRSGNIKSTNNIPLVIK